MAHPLLAAVDKKYQRTSALDFKIGDTVVVTLRIIEGEKERLQDFEGTVIARKGHGLDEMFTVRRLLGNEGIERSFALHSPKIVAIKSVRSGQIRRSKLYFLRGRVGKARKLREKRISAEARRAASDARTEKARAMREVAEAVQAAKAGEMAASV